MPQRLAGASQIEAPLVHVQGDRPKTVLHETDQALGAGRPQERTHFDGSGGAFLLALLAETRASEPAGGQRMRSTRNAKETTGEGPVDLVSMGPAKDVEQVGDVRCARAGSCESRVPQPCEGAVKPCAWVAHNRLVVWGDVDGSAQTRVGNELASPVHVLSVSHLHHG